MILFRLLGPQELLSRRGIEEEVLDLNGRACRRSNLIQRPHPAPVYPQSVADQVVGRPGNDLHPGYRRYAWEGLSPKPEASYGKEVGEIVVKGDIVTKGYWKLPEETKKSIKEGWLYTGDMAVIDQEGYVTIVDRKKDMILTGGENVYSTEVENILYMHPAILECAVVGVPDQKWGEAVKGIVVLKPSQRATEQEIIQFCKERIAHYKAPKSIDFIEALPRTGSGKIHKKGLRDKYWEGYEKKVH